MTDTDSSLNECRGVPQAETGAKGRVGHLEAIIDRLTALTEPSREVDAMIVAALNNAMVKRYPPTDDFGPKNRWQFWTRDGAHFLGSENKYPVPNFTESIDAILLHLLPEGWGWGRDHMTGAMFVFEKTWPDGKFLIAKDHTPAIALATACIRARMDDNA